MNIHSWESSKFSKKKILKPKNELFLMSIHDILFLVIVSSIEDIKSNIILFLFYFILMFWTM